MAEGVVVGVVVSVTVGETGVVVREEVTVSIIGSIDGTTTTPGDGTIVPGGMTINSAAVGGKTSAGVGVETTATKGTAVGRACCGVSGTRV